MTVFTKHSEAMCGPDGVVYYSQIRALFGLLHFIIIRIFTVLSIYYYLIRCCYSRKVHTHYSFRVREVPVTNVACSLSIMLTGGILALSWLAWQSARYIFEPESFQIQ